ncbi:MAG: MFS transporter [Coriobacteriales bacterium]|jgi:MFS family permease
MESNNQISSGSATKEAASTKAKKPGFVSVNFVLLFIAHFIVVSVYFLLMTTMARHAVEAFACSDSTAGLVASIFLVGGGLSRILAGRYVEVIGLKRSSLIALVLMLVCCLLYPVGDLSLPLMLVIRFMHCVSFGVANTAMPALVTKIIPVEVMGEGTGWFLLSNSLGVGIGPLFGLLVSNSFDYSSLYWLCSGTAVVAIAVTLVLSAGKAPHEGVREAARKLPPFKASTILDPGTRRFSVYMLLTALSYSAITAFISSYAHEIGLGFWAPFVFLVYSIVLILVRPIAGRMQDRRGENSVLYPSLASMAGGGIFCALCAIWPSPVLLLLVGVFAATGFGTALSAGMAVIGREAAGGSSAAGISTFFLLCDIGCGIGPFLLGFAVTALGYAPMYLASAGIAILSVVYYHFAHGRTHKGRSGYRID